MHFATITKEKTKEKLVRVLLGYLFNLFKGSAQETTYVLLLRTNGRHGMWEKRYVTYVSSQKKQKCMSKEYGGITVRCLVT